MEHRASERSKAARLAIRAIAALLLAVPLVASAGRNATANGEWIGFGIPARINVGTVGHFYMSGTDQGTCAGTAPTYFRLDMSKPYFKEFYAMVILAQAHQRPMECIVESGCGTSEVWVQYCTLPF